MEKTHILLYNYIYYLTLIALGGMIVCARISWFHDFNSIFIRKSSKFHSYFDLDTVVCCMVLLRWYWCTISKSHSYLVECLLIWTWHILLTKWYMLLYSSYFTIVCWHWKSQLNLGSPCHSSNQNCINLEFYPWINSASIHINFF